MLLVIRDAHQSTHGVEAPGTTGRSPSEREAKRLATNSASTARDWTLGPSRGAPTCRKELYQWKEVTTRR
eukprot:12351234-Alexandrium_andersonii.AAC.1